MNARYLEFTLPTDGLRNVIEPLASYICAARDPHEALQSGLRTLRHEVEFTRRVAAAHLLLTETR